MRQMPLPYRPSTTADEAWRGSPDHPRCMLDILREAADHLERKNVIVELDIAPSTLSDAIKDKNDKRWAGEWIFTILAMLTKRGDEESASLQRQILEAFAALAPAFVIADANDEPSDEWIAETERELAKAKAKKAKTQARKRAA